MAGRERFQELYDAGCNDLEIARQLGVANTTVGNWRRAAGLPTQNTRVTPEMSAQIRQMAAAGMTDTEIGLHLKIMPSCVCGHRRTKGIKSSIAVRPRDSLRPAIVAMTAAGKSRAEIARALGCSGSYVSLVRWRMRHPNYGKEFMTKRRAYVRSIIEAGA